MLLNKLQLSVTAVLSDCSMTESFCLVTTATGGFWLVSLMHVVLPCNLYVFGPLCCDCDACLFPVDTGWLVLTFQRFRFATPQFIVV